MVAVSRWLEVSAGNVEICIDPEEIPEDVVDVVEKVLTLKLVVGDPELSCVKELDRSLQMTELDARKTDLCQIVFITGGNHQIPG